MDGHILRANLNHFINYKFVPIVCQSSWQSSQNVLISRVPSIFGPFSTTLKWEFCPHGDS